MNISGKRVIVAGGAGGVGMATNRRLLAGGCRVTIWDIDEVRVARARDTLVVEGYEASRVFAHAVDICDNAQVVARLGDALREMGGVDVLVNNAGHLAPGDFLEQPAEVWETTVRVNFVGLVNATRAVLPHLYAQDSGQIVNVSSASSLVGVSGIAVYGATKWSVWGLTEALRHEAKNHGKRVRYSSVHPNYISRGMFEGARIGGLGGLIIPHLPNHDVVAKAIVQEAITRGRRVVLRPRSLRLAVFLRGVLSDSAFGWLVRALRVHTSMSGWTGEQKESA
ncbi:MAG: SDR family NAD(P)-dependent oxidoreductase [Spirochaetota bacterium]